MSDTYTINSGTITLTGTASWADNAVSASYAPSNNVGGINGMAYFTASTTWNVPAGVSNVRVIVVGAGGGSNSPSGTNGCGGGYSEGVISVSGLSTVDVIVGVGGAYPSGTGGSSSFLSIGATGGQGATGTGGYGFGGTFNTSGSSGNFASGYDQPAGATMPGCVPWQYPSPMGEIARLAANIGIAKPTNLVVKGAGGNGAASAGGTDGCVTVYY